LDGLVVWLKELAVFVVICETLLSFSPNGMYKRYIKPFVGLILLLRISAFLFGTVDVDWNKRMDEVFSGYEESVSRYLENVSIVEADMQEEMLPDIWEQTMTEENDKLNNDLINIDTITISPIEIGGTR